MGWCVIIRAINTKDAVNATNFELPYIVLNKIGDKIIKEVKGVNRVLVDIFNKPMATIEWE